MKFTNASIKALKTESERYEAWEENGKGLEYGFLLLGAKVGSICIGLRDVREG